MACPTTEYLVVISSPPDGDGATEAVNKALGQHNTMLIPLDLSDLSKVRKCAEDWAAEDFQALVLNAALQLSAAGAWGPGTEFSLVAWSDSTAPAVK